MCSVRWMLFFLVLSSEVAADDIQASLDSVASLMNKGMPMRVDKNTALVMLESNERELKFHMEIAGNINDSTAQFITEVKKNITSSVCTNKDYEYFLQNNVVIVYAYKTFDKEKIADIKISVEDC